MLMLQVQLIISYNASVSIKLSFDDFLVDEYCVLFVSVTVKLKYASPHIFFTFIYGMFHMSFMELES